ncbi:TIGR03084 family metal-binding protein [Pseudonocardia acidicola]|uniref:TIGR03084 family protein n=1 Tax=Pseudonocardia acidicola TaxID=2724939 RepID=A0ABX1SII5_9PSEU|nr:TIGR03084 family metal-binding protein [Pseudonocardia acidicola]NMI00755.1 TIGR03084 family protein [Pseudonocardia acidicola]
MPVTRDFMDALADDLAAESAALRALLAGLDEDDWRRDTPAAGWTIADQVSHLAHFDDVAVQSATDPEAFRTELEKAVAAGGIDPDQIAERYRELTGMQLLAWFDDARARLIRDFRGLDPSLRVPWFGPAMSAASSLTARIMETWAHGQDVADTVGVQREPTDRLRHVAHIGVGARPFSYAVNGKDAPTAPVRVELTAPSGAVWTWGPEDAADRVTGPALDFCLAVTQRRHRDDTALQITGPAAAEWMSIAQAFAGTAGTGRKPGQFSGSDA